MTYIMSCVWLDYMVKYFQCKNCVGSSPKTKKCVASFLVPGDIRLSLDAICVRGSAFFFCLAARACSKHLLSALPRLSLGAICIRTLFI